MFYHFRQSNSGGSFNIDEKAGLTINVIVEADSAKQANARAEEIGIYFHGAFDCPCCGDRWHSIWDDDDGTAEPTLYGQSIEEYLKSERYKWAEAGKEVAIHYANGTVTWH